VIFSKTKLQININYFKSILITTLMASTVMMKIRFVMLLNIQTINCPITAGVKRLETIIFLLSKLH